MKKISLIIPCYNEEESLPFFYKEAKEVLSKMDYDYELLFVNDGSKDDTLSILKKYASEDKHVKYFSFSRNFVIIPGLFEPPVRTLRATIPENESHIFR